MKVSIYISVVLLAFALIVKYCGTAGTKKENDFLRSNLIIDTVMIDPGDYLIYPSLTSVRSFFSADMRYLYNFNEFDHTIEKID